MESVTQERVLKEFEAERQRLNRDLNHAVTAAAQLERERSGLIAENERIKEAAHADVERARNLSAAVGNVPPLSAIESEIERVEIMLKEITTRIDDPATDLAAVIRMNVERSRLESYLKGIHFVLGSNSK